MRSLYLPANPVIIRELLQQFTRELNECRVEYALVRDLQHKSKIPELYDASLSLIEEVANIIKEDIREVRNGNYTLKLPN